MRIVQLCRLALLTSCILQRLYNQVTCSVYTVPDEMMLSLVTRRLSCLDCISRGWVLHGFPLTGHQAELLSQAGFTPNRSWRDNYCCVQSIFHHCLYPISGER